MSSCGSSRRDGVMWLKREQWGEGLIFTPKYARRCVTWKSLSLLQTPYLHHNMRILDWANLSSLLSLSYGSSFICFLFLSESVYSLSYFQISSSSALFCLFHGCTIISGGKQWGHWLAFTRYSSRQRPAAHFCFLWDAAHVCPKSLLYSQACIGPSLWYPWLRAYTPVHCACWY